MSGCSNKRKAICQEMEICNWITGKGCRRSSTRNIIKSTSPNQQISPSLTNKGVISPSQLRVIQKQVDEVITFKSDAKLLIASKVLKFVRRKFSETAFVNYSVSTLRFLVSSKVLGKKLSSLAKKEGIRRVQRVSEYRSVTSKGKLPITIAVIQGEVFESYFKNTKGNTIHMSNESAHYVAAVLESIIAEVMGLVVKQVKSQNKKTVSINDVKECIKNNEVFANIL